MSPEFDRQIIVQTLRLHPSWLLADIATLVEGSGPFAESLGAVTLAELRAPEPPDFPAALGLPRRIRIAEAERLQGPAFDDVVAEVVSRASPEWVASSYVGALVGGPRWKLQGSLGRLVDAGVLERRGHTSGTRYRVAPSQERLGRSSE